MSEKLPSLAGTKLLFTLDQTLQPPWKKIKWKLPFRLTFPPRGFWVNCDIREHHLGGQWDRRPERTLEARRRP